MSPQAESAKRAARPLFRLSPRARKRLLVASLALVVVGAAVWLRRRWYHITENDAKVLADMVTISSRVDGWVDARSVTDGDAVAPGQELVRLDRRETALEQEALRARLESLRLESERLTAQLAVTQGSTATDVDPSRARYHAAAAAMRAA